MTDEKPRWHYRFDNYKRAFVLIREAIEILEERELSQLEKEGVILETSTPRTVTRAAFAAGLIEDGDAWMRALDARNRMAHTL